MNNNERMMVLKMLEDGKINAEEALKLLDALNANSIDSFIGENAEKLKSIFADVKIKAEDFAKKMEPHVNDAKGKLGDVYKKLEPTIKDVGDKVKKVASDVVDQVNKSLSKKDDKDK
ncbi:MAG: hypothetical protein A2Y24_04280 [Clostridiales bacterium GWE2_32_10]|nr:MAG: hypothetical protein A2Y24_04280 [Clostridiales bacterium GWE2_32_10]HBY19507.1 hypothetical protein [Clostridiales bacterium]